MDATVVQRFGLWLAWGLIAGGVVLVLWQVVTPTPTNDMVLVPSPVATDDALQVTPGMAPSGPDGVVYISGAVMRPGVYPIAADARVVDVVAQAGGLHPDADMVAINLAAPVTDGMHVHVEFVPRTGTDTSATAVTAAPPMLAINEATVADLTELPGIGPALAERIVAYRQAHGDFVDMDALGEVPGIGPALQEKIRPYLRFS